MDNKPRHFKRNDKNFRDRNDRDRNDRNDRNDRDRNDRDRNDNRGDRKGSGRQDGPRKEAILDLTNYHGQQVQVKFIGGRFVVGVLKGHDQLMNLVLEDVVETLRDPHDDSVLTEQTRHLGNVIVRGPQLLTLSPLNGTECVENPFAAPQ